MVRSFGIIPVHKKPFYTGVKPGGRSERNCTHTPTTFHLFVGAAAVISIFSKFVQYIDTSDQFGHSQEALNLPKIVRFHKTLLWCNQVQHGLLCVIGLVKGWCQIEVRGRCYFGRCGGNVAPYRSGILYKYFSYSRSRDAWKSVFCEYPLPCQDFFHPSISRV